MRIRTLDTYQVELADDLLSALSFGPQAILVAPTGSGKSIIIRVTAEDLMRLEITDGTLVLVPQNQIKSSWTDEMCLKFPPTNDSGVVVVRNALDLQPGEWDSNHIGRTRSDREHLKKWLSTSNPVPRGYVSTHQGFARWVKELDFLPADVSHKLLVVDEAHRACHDNQLGSAVNKWLALGGKVLYGTATPFRTHGSLPVPDDLIPAYRSLAEHVASGQHSPQNIVIRTKQFSYQTKNARDLAGDVMPSGDLSVLAGEIRDFWISEGRPKTVLIVPPKGSLRWAEHFAKVMENEARVHVAVGMGSAVQQGLVKLLDREREAAQTGKASEIDIIVACRRFDEGTDWPWCSDVYVLGMSTSMVLFIQRLGRPLRYKGGNPDSPRKGIEGYDPKHQNQATVTYILPKNSEASWEAFETKHTDMAFLTACFMQDVNTGKEYLAEVRNRILDIGRVRPSNTQANLKLWRQIGNAVGLEIEDTKTLYADLKRACHLLDKDNPTDDELRDFMSARMGFDPERVKNAIFARNLRRKLGNPLILHALDARVTQDMLGSRSGGIDRRIVRETLQTVFDEVVTESVTNNAALVQEAKAVLEIQTQFTGEDAKVIAQRMQDRLDNVFIPLTLEQIKKGILEWNQKTGLTPTQWSGDASDIFGFPTNWNNINKRLHTLGTTLARFSHSVGVLSTGKNIAWTREDLARIFQSYFDEHGKAPTKYSGNATKYAGFRITWGGLYSRAHLLGETSDTLLNIVDRRQARNDLQAIKTAVQNYTKTNGKPPSNHSGDAMKFVGYPTIWASIDDQLKKKFDTSLTRLVEELGLNVPDPVITDQTLLTAVHLYQQAHNGKRPTSASGDATPYGIPTSWAAISSHLRRFERGSLSLWIRDSGLANRSHSFVIDIHQIQKAIMSFHEKHGHCPSQNSGDATKEVGCPITWGAIEIRLKKKFKHNLASLAREMGLYTRFQLVLTDEQIRGGINSFTKRQGHPPVQRTGSAIQDLGCPISWACVDQRLRKQGSSLSQLCKEMGLR